MIQNEDVVVCIKYNKKPTLKVSSYSHSLCGTYIGTQIFKGFDPQ